MEELIAGGTVEVRLAQSTEVRTLLQRLGAVAAESTSWGARVAELEVKLSRATQSKNHPQCSLQTYYFLHYNRSNSSVAAPEAAESKLKADLEEAQRTARDLRGQVDQARLNEAKATQELEDTLPAILHAHHNIEKELILTYRRLPDPHFGPIRRSDRLDGAYGGREEGARGGGPGGRGSD